MKGLATAIASIVLPCAAYAADEPRITINDCLLILQGLTAIDQHQVIIGKSPNEQVVTQSYQYDSGAFRGAIAHNISVLTPIQTAAQTAQRAIETEIRQKIPPKDGHLAAIEPGSIEAFEYDRRLRELIDAPCKADLVRLRDSDLFKFPGNELPASAVANLEKIRDK